jgi:hypothetical protein
LEECSRTHSDWWNQLQACRQEAQQLRDRVRECDHLHGLLAERAERAEQQLQEECARCRRLVVGHQVTNFSLEEQLRRAASLPQVPEARSAPSGVASGEGFSGSAGPEDRFVRTEVLSRELDAVRVQLSEAKVCGFPPDSMVAVLTID